MKTITKKKISTEEFDEKFDNGEDITDYLDFSKAKVTVRLQMPASLRKSLIQKAKEKNLTLEAFILDSLQKLVS